MLLFSLLFCFSHWFAFLISIPSLLKLTLNEGFVHLDLIICMRCMLFYLRLFFCGYQFVCGKWHLHIYICRHHLNLAPALWSLTTHSIYKTAEHNILYVVQNKWRKPQGSEWKYGKMTMWYNEPELTKIYSEMSQIIEICGLVTSHLLCFFFLWLL